MLFWHTFFLTLGGCGLVVALAALFLLLARLRSSGKERSQVLVQSEREKLLHLENIALRRRLGWLERRLMAPTPAFDPETPTVGEHPAAGRHYE